MGFPFLANPLDSVGGGIDRMGWQTDEPRQLSHQNDVHTLLVVGEDSDSLDGGFSSSQRLFFFQLILFEYNKIK